MKQIQYYKDFKLNSLDEIFEYLVNTLKDSIYTWNYFTHFGKCISNVKRFEKELNELNTLINIESESMDHKLLQIVNNNYKVKEALLLLIALRIDK